MSKKIKAKEYMNWDKTITNDLTPLEAVISLRTRLEEKGIKDQFLEELIAIETELKRLEELEKDKKYLEEEIERYSRLYENFKGGYIEQKTTLEKQDEVLTIIKKYEVDVGWLMRCETLNEYNNCIGTSTHNLLNEEMFKTLKEAFINESNND